MVGVPDPSGPGQIAALKAQACQNTPRAEGFAKNLDIADAVLNSQTASTGFQHPLRRLSSFASRIRIDGDQNHVRRRGILGLRGGSRANHEVAFRFFEAQSAGIDPIDVLLPQVDKRHLRADPRKPAAVHATHVAGADNHELTGRPHILGS